MGAWKAKLSAVRAYCWNATYVSPMLIYYQELLPISRLLWGFEEIIQSLAHLSLDHISPFDCNLVNTAEPTNQNISGLRDEISSSHAVEWEGGSPGRHAQHSKYPSQLLVHIPTILYSTTISGLTREPFKEQRLSGLRIMKEEMLPYHGFCYSVYPHVSDLAHGVLSLILWLFRLPCKRIRGSGHAQCTW